MSNIALWKTKSKEELEKIVKSSFSYREVARKIGYNQNGGSSTSSVKRMIEFYNFDISHFTGQGWNKENYQDDLIFVPNSNPKQDTRRKRLIQLRGQKCENCGLTEWLGMPINLEVHHIDGDRTNNVQENLILLCPNCHSYTSNYRSKNTKKEIPDEVFVQALKDNTSIHKALKQLNLSSAGGNYERAYKLIRKYNLEHLKEKEKEEKEKKNTEKKPKEKQKKYCERCGKEITSRALKYCEECAHYIQRKVERPSREILKKEIRNESFLAIGRKYGVTDNTIRKWCKAENLPYKKKEINNYSDKEWEFI